MGITRLGHLQVLTEREAVRKLGEDGSALVRRARGEDARAVHPGHETKSVSAETTFATDLTAIADLERHLWRLSEKLARRLKSQDLAAAGVVLKLKTTSFSSRTRAARLPAPTVLPDRLFGAARGVTGARGHRHCVSPDRHRRQPAGAPGSGGSWRSGGYGNASDGGGSGGDRCVTGSVWREFRD